MKFDRASLLPALAAVLVGLSSPSAIAQQYPNKTVTVIVGYNAGGGTDTIARLVADSLSKKWNQQVIVANKPGAAGAIGVHTLKTSAPATRSSAATSPTSASTSASAARCATATSAAGSRSGSIR